MATVSVTHSLPVDPATAWEHLSNLADWKNWLTLHQSWKGDLPEVVAPGTQVTQVLSVMGMANKVEWTVTELDAPSSVTIEGTGMAGVQVRFTLSVAPTESGSSASIDATFSGAMVAGPIGKAVAASARGDLEKSLATLAALVEA